MEVSRRQVLAGAGALGLAAGLSGCADVREAAGYKDNKTFKLPDGPLDPEVRLLERMAFGATADELRRLKEMGREGYVDEQLVAERTEPVHLNLRIHGLEIDQFESEDLQGWSESDIIRQLQQQAILRAAYSPNQLRERMVDLWTNHFNIYARKGHAMYRLPRDQKSVIRDNALGSFPAMLRASAHSPGMLAYLDNTVNRRGVANENYARELMELHALGVHGGYTQRDVQEVARCFTGWGIENRFLRRKGGFRFDPDLHDDGEKVVLGQRIPAGGGVADGERVLDIISKHPSCARFVAGKICRYFLGTTETQWLDRIAKVYSETKGDIRAMLRPLLLSDDLLDAPPLVKRPFDFVVSCLRATNADTDGGQGVQSHLERMGQPLHQWPMPDGYPDKTAAWTGSLLARWNFALALVSGQVPGTRVDVDGLASQEDLVRLGLPGVTGDRQRLVARKARTRAERLALGLMSPEFQWR